MRSLLPRTLLATLLCTLLLPSIVQANTRGISIVAKDAKTGQAGEVQLYRKTFAVIVGIDRYPNLPRDKQLQNAVNDARGIEGVLRRNYRFDEIVTLFDEQATKENVLRLLTADLPARMNEEDALFLFWAGHGDQQKSALGEIGYLIPYDGAAGAIYKNITMAEIRDTVSKIIPAKHAFYVMDACYSGLLATTRSLDNKPKRDLSYLQEVTREGVRQVLTAGGKGEEALDGGPRGHSVFTGRLIEVLEAAGDFVTANEIQAILREKVFQDARARNHTQTPGFGTLYGSGDFVFVPNVQQKVVDVAAEVAKLEAEMAELQRREEAAKSSQNDSARRAVERERQVAEAKLRAEKLRQEQLAEEARRQQEQLQEQQRLAEADRRRKEELALQRSEEEERLARLKAEVEARRQRSTTADGATIEEVVAEIKRLSAEIDGIVSTFTVARQDGEKRINDRYAALLAEVKRAEEEKPLAKDMFESDAEFAERKKNFGQVYTERRRELEAQQKGELSALGNKSESEAAVQTAGLRQEMLVLAHREFPLDSTVLALQVGEYDANKGIFSFALENRQEPVAPIRVAMNGTIRMQRDEAREWWGHLQNGFVHPQVTARPDGQVLQVAIVNDANDDFLLTLEDGEFIPAREKRERKRQRERLRSLVGEMVAVPGGCFPMGNSSDDGGRDEQPEHEVCVTDFQLGKYEVTQGQWREVMGANPSHFSSCGDNCPVENVSWNEVQEFLRKLNQAGLSLRLPTEAEWEYAARSGGKEEKYAGGDDLNAVAWYDKNSGGKTQPVGRKAPNGLGLYDMSGNVWEWCQDWYDSGYYATSSRQDPQGPPGGFDRVSRGGSWYSGHGLLRSTNRDGFRPAHRLSYLGFRLALSAGSATELSR